MEDRVESLLSERGREMRALLLIGFCLYMVLSLVTFEKAPIGPAGADSIPIPREGLRNAGGVFGYTLASGCLFLFGSAAWIPFVFLLGFGVLRLVGREVERWPWKATGVLVFTALVAILWTPVGSSVTPDHPFGPGGRFGLHMSPTLYSIFGGPGRMLLVLFGCVLSLLLATDWAFSHVLLRGVQGAMEGLRGLHGRLMGRAEDEEWEYEEEEEEEWEYEDEEEEEEEEVKPKRKPRKSARKAAQKAAAEEAADKEEVEPAAKKARRKTSRKAAKKAAVAEAAVGDDAEVVPEEEVTGSETGSSEADSTAGPKPAKAKKGARRKAAAASAAPEEDEPAVELPRPTPKPKPAPVRIKRRKPAVVVQQPLPFDEAYPYPPDSLFQEPPPPDSSFTDEIARENASAIERRLASFKIESQVVGVAPGPAVTQYELRIAEGVKVNRITSFEPDLAAALKAVAVRVVAPIPGRDTVGIEVPNAERQMVVLRELLEHRGKTEPFGIPLFLGRDVAGDAIVEDLSKMPHLLIAGTTGSGKSVCINTILLSIILTRTPKQCRLILIDPKMVELQVYANVPHLACPVVTSMKKAPGALDWAVEEMEKRYAKLSAARSNNIRSYNKLGAEELEKRLGHAPAPEDVELPYIVLIIDELADLMNVAAKEVEEYIQRLAQKSRAVGIHVILATQRPSTDVITGVIKANLPCTIGFKVGRKIDSRVILDCNGAEKLLGHGDMLYIGPGESSTRRAQGAYVAEEEIHRVVDYLEEKGARQSFIPDLVQTQTAKKRSAAARDDLYEQAVEVILGQQRGSATLLQRALSVGYTRATRLLELMEQDAIVGPYNGSKSREVHLTLEEWKQQEEANADELAGLGESVEGGGELEMEEAPDDIEDAEIVDVDQALSGDPRGT